MVPRVGHDLHQDEALHDAERDGRVSTAGEGNVHATRLNLASGIADGISGRSAPRRDDVAWAAQAKTYAEFTRQRSHYASGNAEQTHLLVLLLEEKAVLFLGEFLRPATGT